MGDFLLDFRPREARASSAQIARELLRFCDDSRTTTFERDRFTLTLASVDDAAVWGSCEMSVNGQSVFAAAAGRPAFEESEWQAALAEPAEGGAVSKAILHKYLAHGTAALEQLNGHFACFVADERNSALHIANDRFGMCLPFEWNGEHGSVYSSHPDVLAAVTGESDRLDKVSLAEFLITGRVSHPHTYFRNIKALNPGTIQSFDLAQDTVPVCRKRRFFEFDFGRSPQSSDEELALELASAFKRAVRRRTLPLFGLTGIGLSGGMDSRLILSAIESRNNVRAFTLLDRENAESSVARSIAHACGVEFVAIPRPSEYYSDAAPLGARISGATGCLRSNHYLGIRARLKAMGIRNLVTGCYCDYLFKGLSLNTKESRFLRIQKLDSFRLNHYLPHFWPETALAQSVRERLEARFPYANRELSDSDWLRVESARAFPLAYEGDSAMRIVPMRVMPWYLPIADNDLLNVYLRIPSRSKLDTRLFRQMLRHVCPPDVLRIPDNNTGSPCDAGLASRVVHRYRTAIGNRLDRYFCKTIGNGGSWPTWEYYFHHSAEVASAWKRRNPAASELFTEIMGSDPTLQPVTGFRGAQIPLLGRLWTLKLWLEHRCVAPLRKLEQN